MGPPAPPLQEADARVVHHAEPAHAVCGQRQHAGSRRCRTAASPGRGIASAPKVAAEALVAADGTTVRDWSFEPIAETCASQRRDYFARYVIRLPEAAAAGAFRLDIEVVDTLAGTTSRTSLPLEIGAESR